MTFLNFITSYSSAIQTICAVLGLILGLFALVFAIHQIKIAQAQRFFVLKTQFLTEVNHAVIESRKGIYRLDNLKNELLSIVDYNSDPKILDAIQRTQDSLKPLYSAFNTAEEINLQILERFENQDLELSITLLEEVSEVRIGQINSLHKSFLLIEEAIQTFTTHWNAEQLQIKNPQSSCASK